MSLFSLFFDPEIIVTNPNHYFELLSKEDMEVKVGKFRAKHVVTEEDARKVETETKTQ